MARRHVAFALACALGLSSVGIAHAAPKQSFTFTLKGECAESKSEGTIEEDVTNSCYILVGFNPARPFRTVNLQYKDGSAWKFANDDYGDKINMKSGSNKQVEIQVPSYDDEGVFYEVEMVQFRVYIAKSGTYPGVASKPFTINYIPAGGQGDDVDEVDG